MNLYGSVLTSGIEQKTARSEFIRLLAIFGDNLPSHPVTRKKDTEGDVAKCSAQQCPPMEKIIRKRKGNIFAESIICCSCLPRFE